jgi:hypothetical protein
VSLKEAPSLFLSDLSAGGDDSANAHRLSPASLFFDERGELTAEDRIGELFFVVESDLGGDGPFLGELWNRNACCSQGWLRSTAAELRRDGSF